MLFTRASPAIVCLAAALLAVQAATAQVTTTFTYQPGMDSLWSSPANWSPGGGPPNDIDTHLALLPSFLDPGGRDLDIGANNFSVRGLTIQNSPPGYDIVGTTGTLTIGSAGLTHSGAPLSIAAHVHLGSAQTWNVGADLTLSRGFSGAYTLGKTGAGWLIIDSSTSTPNTFFGGYSVSGGRLQAGSDNTRAAQVLRSNPVSLAPGTELRSNSVSGSGTLSAGQLTGSGTVVAGSSQALSLHLRGGASFSGQIVSGGMNIYGSGAQSFSGNGSSVVGALSVNGDARLRLAGAGGASGVLNTFTINLRGGELLLDSSLGNSTNSFGRLPDGVVNFVGRGRLSLVGFGGGTTESVGPLRLWSGAHTINVTNTSGGGSGATLFFNDSGNIRESDAMTVNFVGHGGTLGSSGDNPRVAFAGALSFNSANGMLATSNGLIRNIGWAVVNGTSWAGYGGANGVIALPDTPRDSSNVHAAGVWERTLFTPSTATTSVPTHIGASSSNPVGALKISPSAAGQSLSLGSSFNIYSSALMLVGPHDFTITGGTSNGMIINGAPRYVWVTDSGSTLHYTADFVGDETLNKAGPGTLSLANPVSQQIPEFGRTNILDGTLRATIAALGGPNSANAADFTTINFRGGVLEINGGGSLTRGLGVGNSAGGGIRFSNGSIDSGDGGFSAINGNASVLLTFSPGSIGAGSLVWGGTNFLADGYALVFGSPNANSRISLRNSIGLDANSPFNPYSAREIRVIDNPSSSADVAELQGNVFGSAHSDLMKTGDGELWLTGNNSYGGNTLVQEGTLMAVNGNGIPNTSAVIISNHATAKLRVFSSEQIGALSGGSGANGVVELANDSELTVGDIRHTTFGGDTIGSGSFRKVGAGTLTLTGSNFYGRGLTVDAGKLTVNGSVTIGGGSQAVVNGDGTIGGTGLLVGDLTLNGAATLAPGASAGTLTVNGNLVLNSLSVMAYELSAVDQTVGGGVNDLVTGVNDLTLGGTLTITPATIDSFLAAAAGDTWRLIEYSGTLVNNGLALGAMPQIQSGLTYSIDTSTSGQVNLIVTAVPEAGAWMFAAAATVVSGAVAAGRKRKKAVGSKQ